MTKYQYVDQTGTHTKTRQDILNEYWPIWKSLMIKKHGVQSDLITAESCIDDWCAVNWASEVQDENKLSEIGVSND